MDIDLSKLLDHYHQIKIITIRELHLLGYSAREISRLMGGSNKDVIAKILKGEISDTGGN